MKTIADFTALVKLCIEAAEAKYGKMPPIEIRCDIRGKTAGYAGWKVNRWTGEKSSYVLRFNREAISKHWDEMVQSTIPHEVAHIVCAVFPQLGGDNHNWKWAQIDRELGGTGERCHKMELTPGRKTNRYIYKLPCGEEVNVGPKHHSALQTGKYGYLRNKRTGAVIKREHYLKPA